MSDLPTLTPERLAALKEKVSARLAEQRRKREQPRPPLPGGKPPYDAVFHAGTAWLNALAAGIDNEEALMIGDRIYAALTERKE